MLELTDRDDIARERLELILSDKLMRFNPYRVTDDALVECTGRGYWRPWPSITQMVIFHFQDLKLVCTDKTYYGLFFKVGNSAEDFHFGFHTYAHAMAHIVSKNPIWMTLNGKHVTPSTIERLINRDVFVSHAINCNRGIGKIRPSYRMHLLYGSVSRQAKIIRQAIVQSKLSMLEEVLQFPSHPDYLAYSGKSFDYRTPVLSAINSIRHYPKATPPTIHPLG